MVFYFTLASDPTLFCYMGRDKHENELLIKYGWPEDIWFHVDNHSSAHVYLRMPKGKGIDDLTPEVIEECCQLTKANSIEGCKLNHVRVVYTPWSNLLKTNGMEIGQVGFQVESLRRYYTVEKKNNAMLNKLEKTKITKEDVDFQALRAERDAEERRAERKALLEKQQLEKQEMEARKKAAELKSYASLMDETKMRNNQDEVPDEDDFM
ncbi:coiled-coil domain-containing protein 25 [Trypanosoma conorhini]|uniref:Coiled-coil domain-containing protein 25 n=1 Tax=Trypanosoma conorhini TaxID=83891 RepID=A0A3S5IT52_9TRYP|nr:coiled-coil domain-containing protein 25 [Trypanosoma conorhini]RNF16759.1 coiled-coil domain-containing protein 25 [Trypanosoma conorhini]